MLDMLSGSSRCYEYPVVLIKCREGASLVTSIRRCPKCHWRLVRDRYNPERVWCDRCGYTPR